MLGPRLRMRKKLVYPPGAHLLVPSLCSLCEEFRSRSGPTFQVQITGSGSKLFDIVVFFLNLLGHSNKTNIINIS